VLGCGEAGCGNVRYRLARTHNKIRKEGDTYVVWSGLVKRGVVMSSKLT